MTDHGTEAARFEALLLSALKGVCQLSREQVALLYDHYQLLARWNQVLNLSSIRTMETAVVRHYCESLFLAVNLPVETVSVADVGSGAGLPGIPVAVARPGCKVTLVESHQRKAVFLREATRGYANVRVISMRAEQVGERFEWLVSRAVAWKQIASLVPLIASNLALLVGANDVCNMLKQKGIDWSAPLPLPWGRQRSLILGHSVPRET
jgi:16S rRNA (guanine527-N7)-methyltransferase